MLGFSHNEALLLRILTAVFGDERIVPQMRVIAVCGGEVPTSMELDRISSGGVDLVAWARSSRCLFTIVDDDDAPKLVVDLFDGFDDSIEPHQAEFQKYIRPVLSAVGVNYITISAKELFDMADVGSGVDVCSFLHAKVEDVMSAEVDAS